MLFQVMFESKYICDKNAALNIYKHLHIPDRFTHLQVCLRVNVCVTHAGAARRERAQLRRGRQGSCGGVRGRLHLHVVR